MADTDAAAAAAKKAEANRKKREKAKAKKQAAKADAEKTLIVEALVTNEYLLQPPVPRVDTWFAAYQQAFAAEHEWMEARKQKTSRSMGLTAPQLLPLIFHDESSTGMKRVCFFAHYGLAHDAVGYATIDVDADPTKVCHLRMLLVAPDAQRRGIGLAMLKTIFDCFATREIGLKYAKCHDYHKLYSAVGFKRIGDDDHYVYMVLRRAKT
jgi:GNAT superfamily N-acetyltransferase